MSSVRSHDRDGQGMVTAALLREHLADQPADSYALLADGTTVEIRPAALADFDAVKEMHAAMSPDNSYLRFFNFSRLSAEREAERLCLGGTGREVIPGRVALVALADGRVAGCASYDEEPGGKAEVAFAVAEHMHHQGIATLLLEHLVSAAGSHGISTFTAQTLAENTPMLHVFADAGLPVKQHYQDGVVELTIPLPQDDTGSALDDYLDTVARRERTADVASLRHLLMPHSVAVIGASQRTGTPGRAILDNIRTGGYAGRLYAVHPRARQLGGVHCVPAVLDLPEPPDLAVIAVPAPAVLRVAEDCGRLGAKALTVITTGLDIPGCADLLATCRRHGMRLAGPGSFGVAVPNIGLDATFAITHPAPGPVGLVTQSGGLGLAVMDQLSRLGTGISSFVSVGGKLDISSNDMLLWWEQDEATKLAVLYTESFGNPRKFARTARRVGARKPVLTVYSGGDERARALFEQAGVIIAASLGELIETTALLATQPVPAGQTVAIVSNVGSAAMLAADACTSLGMTVYHPHGMTRRKLGALIAGGGPVAGPVNATAEITSEDFRHCLELIAADDAVDAVVALVQPTAATGDLVAAIAQAEVSIPLAAVVLNQPESVRLLDGKIPAYTYPEAAVAALARAARYGAWRTAPRGEVPSVPGARTADARAITRAIKGWLSPGQAAELLDCYGITVTEAAPDGGTEVVVAVTDDATFGPLVMLGQGGAAAEVLGYSARLAPLTSTDAGTLIRSAHCHDAPALRDLLLRVSRMAEDLPEITDLDLNPVIAATDGVYVTGARIRVVPGHAQDPFLRKLR
jgi:acyl-CoA synthetase (NDP forming)/GNAT superfamily N-acetyltransferase